MSHQDVTMKVNGSDVTRKVVPNRLLRDFIRDQLGLTGTKAACDDGMCGACSVLLDGEVVKSCLVLAVQADSREVTTVEGLGGEDQLHPVQAAMIEHFGFQCGFCTPGFVMTAAALIDDGLTDDIDAWREALVGNICRCTGYARIVKACAAAGRDIDRD